jgi:hypothetical protein
MVMANQSSEYIVSGATQKLDSLDWPSHLVIFDKYYLQSVAYEDAIPGVSWYIVVLMPAQIQDAALESSNKQFSAVLSISAVGLIIAAAGFAFTVVDRNSALLKMTRPPLTRLVLGACMMLSVASALMVGPNTDVLCTLRPWVLHLSFTLGLAPLLAKAYMVHYIFNLHPLQKRVAELKYVFVFTFALVCLDAVLIAVLAYGVGPGTGSAVVTELLQNGAYGQLTVCKFDNNKPFLIAEILFKGVLLIAACILCWKVRHVADVLAGRLGLILTVYTTSIVCGIILLVLASVSDVPTRVVIVAIGICFCASITATSLTIPNCYQLWTIGDEVAAEEAKQDVFGQDGAR